MSKQVNVEAFAVGEDGAKAAVSGATGKMAIIRRDSDSPYKYTVDMADIDKIANVEKKIPLEWIDRENTYVKQEFIDYCRPLIQGELSLVMHDGLPKHMKLTK